MVLKRGVHWKVESVNFPAEKSTSSWPCNAEEDQGKVDSPSFRLRMHCKYSLGCR